MIIADFLVIGGGIIGVSVAKEIKKRFPDSKVVLIDKEKKLGMHASGRNSGVLHAGFYYSSDSLKARFTKEGNKQLTKYCLEKNIKINRCGKLVVAKNENELPMLDELLTRGEKNEVELQSISESDAKKIEPRVKTFKRAIFSPTTSTVDPLEILTSFENDARSMGVEFYYSSDFLSIKSNLVSTLTHKIKAGYVINSAGLYADKIAMNFGFSKKYRILPFKGLYLYSEEPVGSLHTNIYPVPNLKNPFLGVHFTITVDGHIKVGPTAIPAFWREQYKFFDNFKLTEFLDIIFRQASLLYYSDFDFKKLVLEEIVKYSRSKMVFLASSLIEGVKMENYKHWGKSGIRAQLIDIENKKLEMDFVIEGDNKSMHILNAVSPGFTCAIPFSSYICDEIEKKLN